MRVKTTIVFAATTVISIILLRNSIQSTKWYASIVNVTEDNETKQAPDIVVRNLQPTVMLVYKKFDNELSVIGATIANLRSLSDSVDRQSYLLQKSANQTIRDLEAEVQTQLQHLNQLYHRYHVKLGNIPTNGSYYESIQEHMKVTIDNGKKQLNESQREIETGLNKWKELKRDLSTMVAELVEMGNDFNSELVESEISNVESLTFTIRSDMVEKVNGVLNNVTLQVQNMSVENVVDEETLGSVVGVGIKKLRKISHWVEGSLLEVDLKTERFINEKRQECFSVIQDSRETYYEVRKRMIALVQGVETAIDGKSHLVEDVEKQIEEMRELRVKVVTGEDERPLGRNETVPFCGVLPNETLASYKKEMNKSTMINYGQKADGSEYIREITKEETKEGLRVKEVFFDEEGLVESEQFYLFSYGR